MEGGESNPLSARAERRLAAMAIVAGVLLRGIPALFPSYWYDEIFTVAISTRSWGEIAAITRADVHPPLYYWMVHALMRAGEAFGGPFISLAWLRLSSVLPGIAIMLIGWRLARRAWGAATGLIALAALALSPPLAFFSVELRNYSFAMAALLAGTYSLLRALEPEPGRPAWPWAVAYAVSVASAFYAANLAALYFLAHAAVLAFALVRPAAPRREIFNRATLALLLISVICLPSVPASLEQNARLQAMEIPWMPTARWRDLASTLFFYLPCGPLEQIDPFKRPFNFALGLGIAGFALVAGAALRQSLKRGGSSLALSVLPGVAAGALIAIPLGIAFADSKLGVAKVFLPTRYNMMAAPYAALAFAALLGSLRPGRLRAALVSAFLVWELGWSIHGQALRVAMRDDRRPLPNLLASFGFDPARDAVAWSDPALASWLPPLKGAPILGHESLRSGLPAAPGRVWFVSHLTAWLNQEADCDAARSLEFALNARGDTHENLEKEAWMWDSVWAVTAARLPELFALADTTLAEIRRQRAEFDGAQLILPTHRSFHLNPGFARPQAADGGGVACWTRGGSSVVEWFGPEEPGVYRVRAVFWRPQPFPEPEQTILYDFSAEGAWRTAPAPVGSVIVEGEVEILAPRQPIRAGFQVPAWIPKERIPGSSDDRPLGIQLLRIEVLSGLSGGPSPGG